MLDAVELAEIDEEGNVLTSLATRKAYRMRITTTRSPGLARQRHCSAPPPRRGRVLTALAGLGQPLPSIRLLAFPLAGWASPPPLRRRGALAYGAQAEPPRRGVRGATTILGGSPYPKRFENK